MSDKPHVNDTAELLKRKQSFVLNNEHSDMIVNDLLQGEYEILGRIFTDLVNYNVHGDESIVDLDDTMDKAERTARRLFKVDSENYINHWIGRSQQNAKNRTSGQEPDQEELLSYARSKGYDEQTVIKWSIEQAHRDWTDQNGDPIKYWRKTLDSYMKAVNRNRLRDMTNGIGRR